MRYVFANNATGTLKTAIGTGDTTIVLEAGDGAVFPTPNSDEGFYFIMFEGGTTEWMLCTTRSSDTFTVTRSSSPSSFSAGAGVELRLNATVLDNFMQKGVERTVTSDPNGTAANYFGEEVYESTTGVWYKHCDGTLWKILTG